MPAVADITKVEAPVDAVSGETVIVDVHTKNIATTDRYIAVTGVYDSTALFWQFDYLLLIPGQTVVMRGSFIMPSKSVEVKVWAFYWDGSQWIFDDEAVVDIGLRTMVVEFRLLEVVYSRG